MLQFQYYTNYSVNKYSRITCLVQFTFDCIHHIHDQRNFVSLDDLARDQQWYFVWNSRNEVCTVFTYEMKNSWHHLTGNWFHRLTTRLSRSWFGLFVFDILSITPLSLPFRRFETINRENIQSWRILFWPTQIDMYGTKTIFSYDITIMFTALFHLHCVKLWFLSSGCVALWYYSPKVTVVNPELNRQ